MRYIAKRLVLTMLMLFLVSLLTFVIFFSLPSGDPTLRFIGHATTPAAIADARKAFGLDRPWYVQYWNFAKGIIPLPQTFLNKRVYYSYNTGVPVRDELLSRAPVSAVLAAGAVVIWLLVSIPLGIIGAKWPRGVVDRAALTGSLLFVSVPSFTIAYVLLYVFWYKLGVAPASGLPPGESLWHSVLRGRFVLPWVTLALFPLALYTRMIRSHVSDALGSDAIRTVRAKGLPERTVVMRHALRAATVPLSTMLALDIASLLGGAVVIETLFDLPGVGQYTVQAATGADIPSIMGITIFASLCILIANLVIDVLYAVLDPRIRRP
jgi:peptide/nickel transport system permease protein